MLPNQLANLKPGDHVSVTTESGTAYTGVFERAFDNKIVIYTTGGNAALAPSGVAETIIDLTGAVIQRLSNVSARSAE